MYIHSVQYSCVVVLVFWLWWEIDLKMRTRFYQKILLGYLFLLLRISLLYCIDLHPYNQYRFSKILRPFCANRNW
jgi:hypothetical protein